MALRYHLLDVFTDRRFGGNPLAVFPEADTGLSTETMQAIARELNLSETVFVFPPERGGLRKVRIFTPRSELPFAGHPTIGTAILLAGLGAAPQPEGECRIVLEEGVGPVPVALRMKQGRPEFAQLTAQPPELRAVPLARERIAAMLSLEVADLHPGPLEPVAASCGVPFFFVPLRSRAALARAALDLGVWRQELAGSWAEYVHVYALEAELPGSDLRARMFAPAAGIAEDPATGGAAAALAGILALQRSEESGTFRWTLEQGFEMGRPSLLYLEADKSGGSVNAVRVGGRAVVIGEGTLRAG